MKQAQEVLIIALILWSDIACHFRQTRTQGQS